MGSDPASELGSHADGSGEAVILLGAGDSAVDGSPNPAETASSTPLRRSSDPPPSATAPPPSQQRDQASNVSALPTPKSSALVVSPIRAMPSPRSRPPIPAGPLLTREQVLAALDEATGIVLSPIIISITFMIMSNFGRSDSYLNHCIFIRRRRTSVVHPCCSPM